MLHIIHTYAIYAILFAILAFLVAKFMDFTAFKTDKQILSDIKALLFDANTIKIGNKTVNYRRISMLVPVIILLSYLLF